MDSPSREDREAGERPADFRLTRESSVLLAARDEELLGTQACTRANR